MDAGGLRKVGKRLTRFPFEESKLFELERETHFKDMPGHIDFFHKGFLTVVDWKTSTKKNLKNFPSQQNIWQIQNYGLMKTCEGVLVRKVALVIIPRDGRLDEIAQWVGDYDEAEALKGQAWLEDVKSRTRAPEPERSAKSYCPTYCQFFDPTALIGCPGLAKSW